MQTASLLKCDGVWLLRFRIDLLPLKKAIGRHQAATAFHGFTKYGTRGDGFRLRVDRGISDFRILGPKRNQALSHDGEFTLAGLAVESDHRLQTLRSDIV